MSFMLGIGMNKNNRCVFIGISVICKLVYGEVTWILVPADRISETTDKYRVFSVKRHKCTELLSPLAQRELCFTVLSLKHTSNGGLRAPLISLKTSCILLFWFTLAAFSLFVLSQ